MSGIAVQRHGTWQTAYWSQGIEGGAEYCDSVMESLDRTRELYERIMSEAAGNDDLYTAAERLHDLCEEKQGRYAPDIFLGTKVIMRGRGEPGRTPFNYPDYRHRFSRIDDLSGFFDRKEALHRGCSLLLEKLIAAFPKDKGELRDELMKHSRSRIKWAVRRANASRSPNEFLLPHPTRTPLELMNIGWLHRQGCYGHGAEATVADLFSPDKDHRSLTGVFVEDSSVQMMEEDSSAKDSHATATVGIISAKYNLENGHVGAAPLARVRILEMDRKWSAPLSEIVNFSGTFRDEHWETIQDPEYLLHSLGSTYPPFKKKLSKIAQISDKALQSQLLQHFYQSAQLKLRQRFLKLAANKLLVQSNGNDGVFIDANLSIAIKEAYFLNDARITDLCIRVVNVQPNGFYLRPTATLPGVRFAESAVCAVGTDVLTTAPGGGYAVVHGASFATPYVTSVALLLRAAFPELSIEQIRWCILEGATPIVLDDNFEPHLIENQEDLQNYSPEAIKVSRLFFGRGLLNGKRAYEFAQALMNS